MSGEQGQRDGEIQVVAGLAQVGRSQVDDDGTCREVESAVLDGGTDPFPALPDGGVRQADDLHLGQAEAHVDLDLDGQRLDPHGVAAVA